MSIHVSEYAVWLVVPMLQTVLLFVLWKRALYRRLPFFFSYIGLQVLSIVFLFVIGRHLPSFAAGVYWIASVSSVLLLIGVLGEVLDNIFRIEPGLTDLGTILFRWSAIVIVLAAVIGVVKTGHFTLLEAVGKGVLFAEASIRSILFVFLVFVLLAIRYLNLTRQRMEFGVVLGFGLFALADMIAATLMAHRPLFYAPLYREIDGIACVASCIAWLGFASFVNVPPVPIRL